MAEAGPPTVNPWTALIEDPAVEAEFRSAGAAAELWSLWVFGVVLGLATVAFIPSDFRFIDGSWVYAVLAARGAFLVVVGIALATATRQRHARRAGPLMMTATVAIVVAINTSRPIDYYANASIDLVVVIAIMLAAPLNYPWRIGLGASFIGANLLVHLITRHQTPAPVATAITVGYITAAILGGADAYASERRRRELFLALRRERATAAALRSAMAELKTLRGIIPICAWCHKVRDDEGLWKQFEHYLSTHTNADFSHAICPDCAQREFDVTAGKDD